MVTSENIYLLGAGFTRAVYPISPLNDELLDAIINTGRAKKISAYQKIYNTKDIERLLTQIDLDGLHCRKIKNDRKVIESEISGFFSNFRFEVLKSKIPSWLETFSKKILKQNDSIINLNYDCMVEGVLDYLGVWTPNNGYAGISAFPSNSILPNPNKIIIHKIHGSENFIESSVIGKNQTEIGFTINGSIYPKSGPNSHIGGGTPNPQPYIIAPSFVKIPHAAIAAMMLDLLDVVIKAKRLAIIGCGMRPEDNFLWLLLTRFLNVSQSGRKTLVILGPTSDKTWKSISNYWVGDIKSFTKVFIIPCGLRDGISDLQSALEA